MPNPEQAASGNAAPLNLSDYRSASEEKRRDMLARVSSVPYSPPKGDYLSCDVARIAQGLMGVRTELQCGTLSTAVAATMLQQIICDLRPLACAADKLEHKLEKAKKKAKRRK